MSATSEAVASPLEAPAAGTQLRDPSPRLPTARDILDAHRNARAVAKAARPVQRRRAGAEPLPTVSREPDHWTVPLWLGWIPATAGTLALGMVSVALSWGWSIDAERAGFLANRLERIRTGAGGGGGNGTKMDPLPEWVKPPEPNWWKTTPGHLTLWALQRDRTANDPDAAEEARDFLAAAAQASPLQARARFAQSRQGPGMGASSDRGPSLALSRDVVALAWTGHQLLVAGKKEPAIRAYHAALEMAAKADLSRLALPTFNNDTQVRRYILPVEDLIGPIVRDLAERNGGSYAEWSAALPPFAVVQLAAARVLLERSSPDAEAAFEAILAQADAPPPAGTTAAVHVAATAEAMALKGRWAEAERRYQQAIDLMPDPSIRRSWWMNLAEIASRLSDESGRQKALEAARGNDPNDEITRRAAEQLKYYGVRTERLGGPNAQDLTASGIP
jgi:hypothetical protein